MRRREAITAGSISLATLAGCITIGDIEALVTDETEYDIGMSRNRFLPEELTVNVNETVVWRNTSEADHTVTAYEAGVPEGAEYFASGDFESEADARTAWDRNFGGRISTGETYSHTFSVPGEYHYVCLPHEVAPMVGMIQVESP